MDIVYYTVNYIINVVLKYKLFCLINSQTSFQNKRHMPVANIISPIIAVNHDSLNCSETVIGIFIGGGCLPPFVRF